MIPSVCDIRGPRPVLIPQNPPVHSSLTMDSQLYSETSPAQDLVQSPSFKEMITRNLHKDKHKIGLAGPGRAGDKWDRWLERIISGKVTKKYYRGQKELWPEE